MDDAPERPRVTGSIVRGVLLVALVLLVAPAVITDADLFAVPALALVALAEIAVMAAGLAYWLLTVGAPGAWLARHWRVTPERVLMVTASVVGSIAAVTLAWFRQERGRPRSALSQLDLRAASTALRLVSEQHLMRTLNTAGIRSMLVLATMLVLAALVTRAFRSAALLTATVAVGGALVELLKTHPLGPVSVLGARAHTGLSWPSGHAALQCSVALGFVLWWWAADLPRPSIVAAIVFPLAVLVGYSRAYLGIHVLSEVLAGWCVAILAASVVVVADRLLASRITVRAPPNRGAVVVAGIIALVATGVAVGADRQFHDRGPRHFPEFVAGAVHGFRSPTPPVEPTRLPSADPKTVLEPLPRFTETLLGNRAQPVGLVIIADPDPLQAAIRRAGWTDAHVVTPNRLPAELWSGLTSWTGLVGGIGAHAPLAPTFFDTRTPDLAVRRASHVAQFWQLPIETPNGCPVWAVTAALARPGAPSWRTLLPKRRIAPAIDPERDALAEALVAADGLDDLGRFAFVAPMHGSGSAGAYVTDGKVAVLRQPGC